jgi:hypothetical protein
VAVTATTSRWLPDTATEGTRERSGNGTSYSRQTARKVRVEEAYKKYRKYIDCP